MAISMTVEEATTLFISIARERGVDPALINRDTIAAEFTKVFARMATPATPEQIGARVAEYMSEHPEDAPDFDELIRRGEV